MSELRTRVLEPVMLPLGALMFAGVFAVSLSRILLAVPEAGAVVIALMVAAEILGIAALLAARARLKPVQRAVLVVAGLALIAGGALGASLGVRDVAGHGARSDGETLLPPAPTPGPPTSAEITAEGIAFNSASLVLQAGIPVTIDFDNQDAGIPHNVAVYTDKTATTKIFAEPPFAGPRRMTYSFTAPQAGTYYFRCDAHPTMEGTITFR